MSADKNDLSDRAMVSRQPTDRSAYQFRRGWLEARERHDAIMAELKANPWQLFEPQDLSAFLSAFNESGGCSS